MDVVYPSRGTERTAEEQWRSPKTAQAAHHGRWAAVPPWAVRPAGRSTAWFSGTLPYNKPRAEFRDVPGRHGVCRQVAPKTIGPPG